MTDTDEYIECVSEIEVMEKDTRYLLLVIYDIVDNKRRTQFVKYVSSYGFRVQKSCFEALIDKSKYRRFIDGIKPYVRVTDSIRVYRIRSRNDIISFGELISYMEEEFIVF